MASALRHQPHCVWGTNPKTIAPQRKSVSFARTLNPHCLTMSCLGISCSHWRMGPTKPCASKRTTGRSFTLPRTAGTLVAGMTAPAGVAAGRTRTYLGQRSRHRKSARTRQSIASSFSPTYAADPEPLSAMRRGRGRGRKGGRKEEREGGFMLRDACAEHVILLLLLMLLLNNEISFSFSFSYYFCRFYCPTDPVSPQGPHSDPLRQIWENPRNGWCHGGMPCLQVWSRWRQRDGGNGSGVLWGSVAFRIGAARSPGVWTRCSLRV
jgi:hypothetical protein